MKCPVGRLDLVYRYRVAFEEPGPLAEPAQMAVHGRAIFAVQLQFLSLSGISEEQPVETTPAIVPNRPEPQDLPVARLRPIAPDAFLPSRRGASQAWNDDHQRHEDDRD